MQQLDEVQGMFLQLCGQREGFLFDNSDMQLCAHHVFPQRVFVTSCATSPTVFCDILGKVREDAGVPPHTVAGADAEQHKGRGSAECKVGS